jgi:hypothetical protein
MPQALPALESAAARDSADMLKALPTPPALPNSLYAPPPRPFSEPLPADGGPYFVRDPLLDLPQFREPGWFGGAEAQILKAHVLNHLSSSFQNPSPPANGISTNVSLPSAPLDWTGAYRIFAGYRLPSGFGEFSASYRNLGTTGSSGLQGPNGPGALRSRLAFEVIDFDYSSRELSAGPNWDMKWTFGIRVLTLFFDSRFTQSFAQAAAGDAITVARVFNNYSAVGPHAALEMARHLGDSGWMLYFKGDFSTDFATIHQGFSTVSSTFGANGQALASQSTQFGHQGTPILLFQTGLSWQPAQFSATRFFAGYQYERWFAVGRLTDQGSIDQLWDQGIVLQASYNF